MKTSLLITLLSIQTINLFADDILKNVNLDEITVTATGYKQDISKAPASVSVISNKEISQKHSQNVVDIVKSIPGIFSNNSGTISNYRNNSNIMIRGMSPKYTKFLVDGKPISSEEIYSGTGNGSVIANFLPPANAIDRIEIIRGPMSSLYGTDAMGGVINIITKKSIDEFSANINAYYTFMQDRDYGDSFQSIFYVLSPLVENQFALELYGKFFQKNEDNILEANPKDNDKNLGLKLIYKPNDDNELSLFYKHTYNYALKTYGKTLSKPYTSEEKDKNDNITLSHLGYYDNITLDSYILYDKTKVDSDMLGSDSKLTNIMLNSKAYYTFDTNILTLGAEYKNQNLAGKSRQKLYSKSDGNLKRWDASIFGEDEYKIFDPLTLTAGIRYNYDKDYGGHISPRAYLIYEINENIFLKGGVSTGYMTPTIKERAKGFLNYAIGGTGVAPGNPDLKPENSTNYEGSIYYQNDIAFMSATLFHTKFKDKIDRKTVCKQGSYRNPATWECVYNATKYYTVLEFQNVGKSDIDGVELSINYQLTDDLNLNTSYTFTKSEQKSGAEKGEPLNDVPTHLFRFGANYDITKTINLWTQFLYNGKVKKHDYTSWIRETKGSYTMFDLGINYGVSKNLNLNAGIYNILNKKLDEELFNRNITIIDGRKFQIGFNINF